MNSDMDCRAYLEDMIQKYERILLLSDGVADCFAEMVEETRAQRKDVLVLTFSELDSVLLKELLDYYYMYSFADHFMVVDDECPRFATILNFVSAGPMSRREAWLALL